MTTYKPHDSHGQKMTPAVQRVIDAADKRARDKAAMPADCPTPTGCREHGCHGECLPDSEGECGMTIVFQGHVARVDLGVDNKLDVHVQTAAAECGQVVVLHVPRSAAAHWLPGRAVQVTAFAFDAEPIRVKVA